MLKTLEPNAFDTAMLPKPCWATSTDETRLGNDVPAAARVRPITAAGMPHMQAIVSAEKHMTYEKIANQTMAIAKQLIQWPSLPGALTFGVVAHRVTFSGKLNTHSTLPNGVSGTLNGLRSSCAASSSPVSMSSVTLGVTVVAAGPSSWMASDSAATQLFLVAGSIALNVRVRPEGILSSKSTPSLSMHSHPPDNLTVPRMCFWGSSSCMGS
mmetsp:Transcript_47915/g.119866  ORF Transcript_47915/g.119866 Transcript_47915/m.119866 type:complete len:212 (-) Transcript_47915:1278-1913(-)